MQGPFYVISLDRTPQRFAQFVEWNPGLAMERISAIDGAAVARSEWVRRGLIAEDNHYVPGALGNAASHIALWQRCAAGSVPFHIAEDDVILRSDFHERAGALLETVAGWDIVLWTHNLDWPAKIRSAVGNTVVLRYDPAEAADSIGQFRRGTVPPQLLPLFSAAGTGCYSISPQGASSLLAACLPIGGAPADYVLQPECKWSNDALDVELCRHYGGRKAYLSFPPLAFAPNDTATSTIRGNLAATAGSREAVAAAVQDTVDPRVVLRRQAEQLVQAGRRTEAVDVLTQLVGLYPNDIWVVTELASALLARKEYAAAEVHARSLVRLAPGQAESHRLAGTVLTALHRPAAGEHHLRMALHLAGPQAAILTNLGWSLREQGRLAEARDIYQRAAALEPDSLPNLYGQGFVEVADRKPQAALPFILQGRDLAPSDDVDLRCLHAEALERLKRPEEALAVLDETRPTALARAQKGRLLDSMGRYDDAFAAFVEAKRCAAATKPPYDHAFAEARAAALAGFFTRGRVASIRPASVRRDVPQPLFIVGFPRSGTTMVEQTLSVLPTILAGDELQFINRLVPRIPVILDSPLAYPDALADLWMGDKINRLDDVRDDYLAGCRDLGLLRDGIVWFTDKMPLNETHLGLIHLIFPRSPVIHLKRHPLDVVLSTFANNMSHGMDCDTGLHSIAHQIRLTSDLVDRYRDAADIRYLSVRYEDIVDHQEASVRQLVDFIGEEFDPSMLRFEQNARLARTASSAQVTEALYRRSRYRYRHYLRHLAPVVPTLRAVIERDGYVIDGPGVTGFASDPAERRAQLEDA